jgi:hypothetical protein
MYSVTNNTMNWAHINKTGIYLPSSLSEPIATRQRVFTARHVALGDAVGCSSSTTSTTSYTRNHATTAAATAENA